MVLRVFGAGAGRSLGIGVANGPLLAAAYFALGWVCLGFSHLTGGSVLIFAPAGLAVGAVFLSGVRVLPWILTGSMLLGLVDDTTRGLALAARDIAPTDPGSILLRALLPAILATAQAALAGGALRRILGAEALFDRVRDVLWLLPVIALGAAAAAVAAVALRALQGGIGASPLMVLGASWTVADALGMVAVFPLVIAHGASPGARWRSRRPYITLPLLLALLVCFFLFRVGAQRYEHSLIEEFRDHADQVVDRLQARFEEQEMLVGYVERFLSHDARGTVPTREEFHVFCAELVRRFPATQAIEWVPEVRPRERPAFEATQRSADPGFAIRERDGSGRLRSASARPLSYPVTYVEPFAGNERAVGFDLASSPEREVAVRVALGRDRPVASAPVTLVQENEGQQGLLLVRGVQLGGANAGVAVVVLRARDFIERSVAIEPKSMRLTLDDVAAGRRVYETAIDTQREARSGFAQDATLVRTFRFGLREYRLAAEPAVDPLASGPGTDLLVLAFGAFGGTWLMASLTLLGTGNTQRVESQVIERTRALEHEIFKSRELLRNASDGVHILDPEGNVLEASDAFCAMLGYTREEVIGMNVARWAVGIRVPASAAVTRRLHREPHFTKARHRRADGSEFDVEVGFRAIEIEGRPALYCASRDISVARRHEEELDRIAHFDVLTGLPNRRLLDERLGGALAASQRERTILAVCYLDLDAFKPINDQHGHAVGDALLVEVARRIQACLRANDTVGRLGGDEFVVILPGLGRPQECQEILQRVLGALREPYLCEGVRLAISASIGVSLCPPDEPDAGTLLRHADQAMYSAKEAGKNCIHNFDREHDLRARVRRHQLGRVEEALAQGELELYYQPKVDLVTREVFGAEALMRWRHPADGLLLPGEFLHFVEGTALEPRLGEWVMETALAQAARWREEGVDLILGVNIGANHLLQPDFTERLRGILSRFPAMAVTRLELEILETSAMGDMGLAARTLNECRSMGVRVALDDFGTGYSSLAHFRQLPVDMLKIDQSFVRDILEDVHDLDIVETIVQLAQVFHYPVIAEGVETAEHGMVMQLLGCRLGQGYGIARPMQAGEIPAWLGRWRQGEIWPARRGVTALRREDIALLTASGSHRHWVEKLEQALADSGVEARREFDFEECSFGLWCRLGGEKRYGSLAEFQAVAPIHDRIHVVAEEIIAFARAGLPEAARDRMPGIYALRDELLARLAALKAKVLGAGMAVTKEDPAGR